VVKPEGGRRASLAVFPPGTRRFGPSVLVLARLALAALPLAAQPLAALPVAVLPLAVLPFAVLAGCGGQARAPNLPAPINETTLGLGDVLEIRIVGAHMTGVNELPSEYKIGPDGAVSLPFVGRTKVVDLEPNEIELLVRQKLIDGDFYTNPQVSVVVRAYLSKRVNIIGQVKKPDSYPIETGMGLQKLISMAGGFTDIADEGNIIIQRKTKQGVKVDSVDYDDIRDGRIADVPLQTGDYIEVKKNPI
jgi:protein involved in polysaccharide export with SLBB domain